VGQEKGGRKEKHHKEEKGFHFTLGTVLEEESETWSGGGGGKKQVKEEPLKNARTKGTEKKTVFNMEVGQMWGGGKKEWWGIR